MKRATLIWGAVISLVAAGILVYFRAARNGFVDWDDRSMLVENPVMAAPVWWGGAQVWREPVLKLYTPLAYTVWSAAAAYQHWHPPFLRPALFHWINIILHIAAGISVFFLLRELFDNLAAAWIGAMVFLLHPLQVEPVAWISGMNGVLSGALAAAALWQYVAAIKHPKSRLAHAIAATVLFIAALLSKPSAVVVPLIAVALDIGVLRRRPRTAVLWALPWAALSGAAAYIAHAAQPAPKIFLPPLWQRLGIAADALVFYAGKIIRPAALTIDYERQPQTVLAHPAMVCLAVAACLAAIALIAWFRRPAWLVAGLAIWAGGLAPVLGLVPFEFQSYSTVADRYMYLPMIGIALLVAGVMGHVRRTFIWCLAGIVLVALAGDSYTQTAAWHTTATLAQRQFAFDPDSPTGHRIYAFWLSVKGDRDQAESEYNAALDSMHDRGDRNNEGVVRYDFGNFLYRQHRYAEAAGQFAAAVDMVPAELRPMVHTNLGAALAISGDKAGARREFLAALAEKPDFIDAQKDLRLLERQYPPTSP